MARIKIDLPESFLFRTEIRIRITDLNYGGHLGNDAFLAIAHEARCRFLKSFGYDSELDINGLGLIMADAAVQFKAEGFYGDSLICQVTPQNLSRSSFDLYYLFKSKNSGTEVARIKTGMLFFNYENRKIAQIPEEIKDKWKG